MKSNIKTEINAKQEEKGMSVNNMNNLNSEEVAKFLATVDFESVQQSLQALQMMQKLASENSATIPQVQSARTLPKGITEHQGGYLARWQYNNKKYSLFDKDLERLIAKFEDLKYEVRHGKYHQSTKMTFGDWSEKWLKEHRVYNGPKLRPTSIRNYSCMLKNCVPENIRKKKLDKISSDDIHYMMDAMVSKYAYNTIKVFRDMLSGIFSDAVKRGYIVKNPVSDTALPVSRPSKEAYALTKEQASAFLKYAEQPELHPLFVIALETGMRCGELRALQWSNVDFDKKVIKVEHTLQYDNATYYFGEPKTESSRRRIPMTDRAYQTLLEWKNFQNALINAAKSWEGRDGITDLVFCQFGGKPYSKCTVKKQIDKIVKKMIADGVAIKRFTPHCLRHTFASRCIENGISPNVLQKILGHKDLETTLGTYVHIFEQFQRSELEKLGNW